MIYCKFLTTVWNTIMKENMSTDLLIDLVLNFELNS